MVVHGNQDGNGDQNGSVGTLGGEQSDLSLLGES